ncbi:MAG TPA: aminoacyl-tRNA hydrolase [Chloroflexi bacterium]|nr:aminoacyl-tRNA hydrolase [Chloroflexota bacterium]
MIKITSEIFLNEDEIKMRFIRASGPGGQNVNKVSTAAQLHFDVANSPSLPYDARQRLIQLAGHKMTENGVLVITARKHRTQEQNRQETLARLLILIRQALQKPKKRRKTKATLASKKRRLEAKHRHSQKKRLRQKPKITE